MMNILAHSGVFLLLISLTSAAFECIYKGVSYANKATFTHGNGCATLQCQFGEVFTFVEACGKEIDGKCHRVNEQYVVNGDTYQCRKVPVGDAFVFKNEIAIKKITGCDDEGKTYKNMEKFKRAKSCQPLQCQNGYVVPLNEGCGETIDGKCHMVGEQYSKDGVNYICTARERNGQTLFENIVLDEKLGTLPCSGWNGKYAHLEVFAVLNNCVIRQCVNKQIKVIQPGCSDKQNGGTCYAVGEQWEVEGKAFGCVLNDDKTAGKVVSNTKVFRSCSSSEHQYEHMDIYPNQGRCATDQCQDGKGVTIAASCYSGQDKQCHDMDMIYTIGKKTFKCIKDEVGMSRIVELDENGNVIEKPTKAPPSFNASCPDLAADIVFVWDASGSIAKINFGRILNFSCDIVGAFQINSDHVKVGGVVFASSAEKRFDLDTFSDLNSLCLDGIKSIAYLKTYTETQKAFNIIVDDGMFQPDAGGRPEIPDIVIVITDGESTNTEITLAAAGQVKALGVQMISVGIGDVSVPELEGIASRPENVFTIKNYDALLELRQMMAERACEIPYEPPVPPKEGPVPKCPSSLSDIIFILDSSSDVGADNYKKQLNMAADLASMFTVSTNAVQIGAVLIGTQPKNLFDLNTYSTTASVSKALADAPYISGDREVDDALELVINDGLFTASHGGRDTASRIAVIIIDGEPTDWARSLPLAKKLRNQGVRVFTIGIGNYVMQKLKGLSGNPTYVFNSPSYDLLTHTKPLLYHRLCNATSQPRPPYEPPRCSDTETLPCEHICENTETAYECSCQTGFTINKADKTKCDDKDECASSSSLCSQICENVVGSYRCACEKGYKVSSVDSSICIDDNECLSFPCQVACTNTIGSYRCTCKDGYQVNASDPAICEDVDECKTQSPCQQTCTNTEGGYDCSCKPGYVISPTDPTKCEDVDECTSSPCQQTCTNTDGGYTCSCESGYVISSTDPDKCDDVDECTTQTPCEQTCANTDGGFTCSCESGYVVSPADPNKCDDVDECTTQSPCQQTCTNTAGGFSCSCESGYVVSPADHNKCDDVDECTSSPCQHRCKNTVGNYTCSCNPGYVVSPTDPNKCEDTDECASSPCQHTCENTDGGYTCSCNSGYVVSPKDPNKCEDTDECASSPCQHTCENTDGGYTCSCNSGYVVSPTDQNKCEDTDECAKSPCQHTCENTDGGYTCSCNSGYVVSPKDPTKCEDTDECAKSPCQHTCENTDGGYTCSCNSGYVVSPKDPTKCEDVDECSSTPCQHTCKNTNGSYTCSCDPGYVVSPTDPNKCEDVDECTTDSPCQQNCKNTIGSYVCSCKPGYVVRPSYPNKCDDINECLDDVNPPCHHNCTNTEGSFACHCRNGYEPNLCDPNICKDIDECEHNPCENACINTRGSYQCVSD